MAYAYKKQITIDNTKVAGSSDFSNFPMLISRTDVDLKTAANGGHVQNSNGHDIIFKDVTETTQLDHEIEKYIATTGEIAMWVRIPTLGAMSDTTIWIYYGDSSISSSQEDIPGTWDSNYKTVWHSSDNAANTTVKDSTSSGFDATNAANTSTKTTTGKVASALSYNGSSDYALRAYNANLNPAQFTVQAWVKISGGQGTFRAIASNRDDGGGSNTKGWILYCSSNNTFEGWTGKGGFGWDVVTSSTFSTDTWYLVHFSYNGTTSALYVDGSLVQSGTKTYVQQTSYETRIGAGQNESSPNFYFNGVIDEVRISNATRSADWVATEYNNHSSPSTFYSVGSEQLVGGQAVPPPPLIGYGRSGSATGQGRSGNATGYGRSGNAIGKGGTP